MTAHVRQKRNGSVRDIVPKDIKTVVVDHTLPDEERQCPQCGKVMEDIGTEVKETLKIKPAEVRGTSNTPTPAPTVRRTTSVCRW